MTKLLIVGVIGYLVYANFDTLSEALSLQKKAEAREVLKDAGQAIEKPPSHVDPLVQAEQERLNAERTRMLKERTEAALDSLRTD